MADAPANQENKKAAQSSDEGGTKEVELLARFYMQPVPDTKPQKYRRYNKGAILTVTDAEFELGNQFKPSFKEVETNL